MIVVGLDLSLTSTGIARIWIDHDPAAPPHTLVDRVTSTGKEDATVMQRHNRLMRLRKQISSLALPADLAVIEAPAYSRTAGHQHDRSGLWWAVVRNLFMNDVPVVEVPPTTRARYACGKAAKKDAVLAAVVRRYPDVEVTGNDEADALILAAMGARHLGSPIDDLPKTHLAAMDAVRWPEGIGS